MHKLHAARHERYTAIGVAAGCTILQIAFNGTAHGCQLTADLVVATGHQIHFEHAVVIGVTDDAILQDGFLGVRALAVVGLRLVLLLVTNEPVLQCTFQLLGGVLDYRPIGFMHFALGKHLVESGECFRGSGKDYQS